MAVDFFSLPKQIQNKINQMKITAIQKIIAHDYPSGQTEIEVCATDSHGWNVCKIFSY